MIMRRRLKVSKSIRHCRDLSGCPQRSERSGRIEKDVTAYVGEMYPQADKTFKVEARRANKRYPMNSMELNCALGEAVLDAYPEMKVDVHDPEVRLNVEIREEVYIYSEIIPGPGGMPVGTNGSAMLLLSGGIDSPVAGYMVAKRGVELEAVYFHAPPYTVRERKKSDRSCKTRICLFRSDQASHC